MQIPPEKRLYLFKMSSKADVSSVLWFESETGEMRDEDVFRICVFT